MAVGEGYGQLMSASHHVLKRARVKALDHRLFALAMLKFPLEEIKKYSNLHPKPTDVRYQYGTAGFRTLYVNTFHV